MNKTRNFNSVSAKVIVWMFVLAAAALSAHDIVSLFERLEAPRPLSFLAPVFIDGITWLGKLMRSHKLSKRTNRTGLYYLVIGGGASLAANLVAGETLGMKLLGLLAVTGFILGEIALDKIEPRVEEATDDEPTLTAKPRRKPCEHEVKARKNARYGDKSATEKREWTTKFLARHTVCMPSNAPTSPAWAIEGRQPSAEELASINS